SHLWISKCTPGDHTIIDFLFSDWHKCVAYRNSRLICCYMRKEIVTGDIPNRYNIGCGRLKVFIHVYAFAGIHDARSFEIQSLYIWSPAQGKQDFISLEI